MAKLTDIIKTFVRSAIASELGVLAATGIISYTSDIPVESLLDYSTIQTGLIAIPLSIGARRAYQTYKKGED